MGPPGWGPGAPAPGATGPCGPGMGPAGPPGPMPGPMGPGPMNNGMMGPPAGGYQGGWGGPPPPYGPQGNYSMIKLINKEQTKVCFHPFSR